MRNLSLQEKEQNIVATLICCNNILKHKNKNSYNKNMMKLYESIVGTNNFDYEEINKYNQINFDDFNGNKFAYFNSVNKLLENYDIKILTSLNENFEIEKINDFNIITFKNNLNKIINELSKSNDFNILDSINSNILNIKLFTKKPIYVYGFDIMNYDNFEKIIKNKFSIDINNIYSIIFDKTNKELLFVLPNNTILNYSIKTNEFIFENLTYNFDNYYSVICENKNNNMIKLFVKIDTSKIKFSDNLYNDNLNKEYINKMNYENTNLFFKT